MSTATAPEATFTNTKGYVHPEVLVSTDWVAQHLNDPSVRILESDEDVLLYDLGHIPGAQKIDWHTDLNDSVVRDYVSREQFQALLRKLGIDESTTVVFYGDKSNWWATYAFWVFQLFGFTNSKIVDGGRAKWEAEGRPLETDVKTYPPTQYVAPRSATTPGSAPSRTRRWRTARRRSPLIDVRSPDEFSGKKTHMPEYPQEGVLRGGHVPGAKSVPWARAANPDGTFKTADELRAIYEGEAGLKKSDDVDRLLPHRRALEPHLVRAHLPARLRQGAQLRRQLDGVGQLGPPPGREVST